MEKKERLEKIKLEYDLYSCNIDFLGMEAVLQAVANKTEEHDLLRDIINIRRKKNRRDKLMSKALGKYASRFGYLDTWYYDTDNSMLDKKVAILDKFYQQLGRLYVKMNVDNYLDIYKLLCFSGDKTGSYLSSVDEERICVRQSSNGASFERKLPKEESEVFAEFFVEAIENISYTRSVEKVKK